jgi:hypothetical protein
VTSIFAARAMAREEDATIQHTRCCLSIHLVDDDDDDDDNTRSLWAGLVSLTSSQRLSSLKYLVTRCKLIVVEISSSN